MTAAPAALLAEAYHQRWEHETGNAHLKTCLRGPSKVLRSRSPDMVRQEVYGYLLTHYALSSLICRAATEAGIDPKRTVRIVRRRAADPAAFPSDQRERILAKVMADITMKKNLNPCRRRTYPRVVKRARHNSQRVKRPGDTGVRHDGPATIRLVNLQPIGPRSVISFGSAALALERVMRGPCLGAVVQRTSSTFLADQ